MKRWPEERLRRRKMTVFLSTNCLFNPLELVWGRGVTVWGAIGIGIPERGQVACRTEGPSGAAVLFQLGRQTEV